jgi:hypothetical protein
VTVASTSIESLDLKLDPRTLWAGGVAASLVAALVAIVGILICRGLLHINVLIGLAIYTLVSVTAERSRVRPAPSEFATGGH